MYKIIDEENLSKHLESVKLPEDSPECAGETVTAGLPDLVRPGHLGCLGLQQISDTVVQTLPHLDMNSQGIIILRWTIREPTFSSLSAC